MIESSAIYSSPCGELFLAASPAGLRICDWLAGPRFDRALLAAPRRNDAVIARAFDALDCYFATGRCGDDVPLDSAGTPFRLEVWQALRAIAPATTTTYAAVAAAIGRPAATRAVASAIASNLISVFIPCHRVVAAGGTVGGYRGSTAVKRFLLELESRSL